MGLFEHGGNDMSDQSPATPLFVSTYSIHSAAMTMRNQGAFTISSLAWVTANLAVYVPVFLPWPYPVRRVFWVNGSSAGGNNDFGIYTQSGAKLYSTGSTAVSGNSAPQFVTPTAFMLDAGVYYFSLAVDSTTAGRITGNNAHTANQLRLGGILQQGSALPLPAVATFAASTDAIYPFCGITKTESGF
jgi:hypothetical protein